MKKKNRKISVGFIALGCPKNIVDSEKMLAGLGEAGFVISPDAEAADVVVINTCGFISPAKSEAMEAIAEALEWKQDGLISRVVVAGCLSQRMGSELFEEAPGIDAVVGLGQRDRLAEIIREVVAGGQARTYMGEAAAEQDDSGRLLITPSHWAYLRISEGCDHRCSFCTIPAIRGRFRSKLPQQVVLEAKELADSGVVELNIIAQDSNYYGRDLGMKDGLVRLIDELEGIEGVEWIRLMYMYPAGMDDALIARIAGSRKVVPYIDMPIQHINNTILRAMRRSDTKEKNTRLVEKLRQAMPEVSLRTTVIVGFPGESQEQFEELVEFVEWAKFDHLGCFPFFPEPGTAAAELEGQIDEEVTNERVDAMMTAQQGLVFAKNRERIGKRYRCLVDHADEEGAEGRIYSQAPHIDSICILEDCTAQAGEFVEVQIEDVEDYDFVARQI